MVENAVPAPYRIEALKSVQTPFVALTPCLGVKGGVR